MPSSSPSSGARWWTSTPWRPRWRRTGWAGSPIDAYVSEPPDVSHPVFAHPRAVFTPHSGADTKEGLENVGMMVIESLDALFAGDMPPRCLNAQDLAAR